MVCAICHRPLPYVGASCAECASQSETVLDWDAILTRVAKVDVPPWVKSPMG
jgi:hypothetical protein